MPQSSTEPLFVSFHFTRQYLFHLKQVLVLSPTFSALYCQRSRTGMRPGRIVLHRLDAIARYFRYDFVLDPMKYLCLTIAILLSHPPSAYGQDVASLDCPRLEVIGPRGIISLNEPATFVLQSEQDFPEAYKYEWSVENGTITRGQGTRVVEIVAHLRGTNIQATVTVAGFPAHCSNIASEIVGVESQIQWHATDEWGELPNDDQRGRLDLFFAELSNNPSHMGLIFIDAENQATERRRLKLVLDHARFRKFDKSQLLFCLGRSDWNQTRVFRLPPQLVPEISDMGCTPKLGSLLK